MICMMHLPGGLKTPWHEREHLPHVGDVVVFGADRYAVVHRVSFTFADGTTECVNMGEEQYGRKVYEGFCKLFGITVREDGR